MSNKLYIKYFINEIFTETKNILKKYPKNMVQEYNDDDIKNVILLLIKNNYKYDIISGITTDKNGFVECFSNRKDIPQLPQAIKHFINRASYEIIGKLSNFRFNLKTLKYEL